MVVVLEHFKDSFGIPFTRFSDSAALFSLHSTVCVSRICSIPSKLSCTVQILVGMGLFS